MFSYCLGIRVNDIFQERTCEHLEHCPYYKNTNLRTALMHPEQYVELDTYNDKECIYKPNYQPKVSNDSDGVF